MAISLSDLIKALIKQGVPTKLDGVIVWSHCNYCDKTGWVSEVKQGYPLVHEEGCFIMIAQKWIEEQEEPK